MNFRAINQSLVALRAEPFDRSEMVNQLLFGEVFEVFEEYKGWLRVRLSHDSYEGWVDQKASIELTNEQLEWMSLPEVVTVATRFFSAKNKSEDYPIRLCPGSSLYHFNPSEGSFRLGNETYKTYSIPTDTPGKTCRETLVQRAVEFVNSPYLWGGRSPYGIDCSGLIQVLFKMSGISIPRDANQQVAHGSIVSFINMAQPGDLAFFDNEEGLITHVGMIMPNASIIHSSGYVRIDSIDQHGIYSAKAKTYTHKLRVVKDLISGASNGSVNGKQ